MNTKHNLAKLQAKPFVKWAGGKSSLIKEIDNSLLSHLHSIDTYIEPFVGGGAMLFYILNNYPNISKIAINDINSDLTTAYQVIKHDVNDLIDLLMGYESRFLSVITDDEAKKHYYYQQRSTFNQRTADPITQTALFIFLNKTCFNGLYRVNSKNEFNVPIGSYKKPVICDSDNLLAVNTALQKVGIINTDFEQTLKFANDNTLFYFDPPYKPLNTTSSFTAYAQGGFDDGEQIRLANFCQQIDKLGYQWLLSNSDVKGNGVGDDFFDDLYREFTIERISAKRSINANANKRGQVSELLINNFANKL